ncbi:hypothetical protein V2J09_004867 [Rumex salicifolius]
MISTNNAAETVNAAANALGFAETRPPAPTAEKWRWCSCLSIYCCFGSSQKSNKRIRHATLLPQTTATSYRTEPLPSFTIPFIAPPSSPASFLHSETPSSAHSPSPTLLSISANMYSPGGPRSIFSVGPYAHETQLVSPPVFYTEPSTAPFTPPPESSASAYFATRPSSPEVPFAKLLDTSLRNDVVGQRFGPSQYEFQMYQFYPGSPLGQLISPGSTVSRSGTSSPFPDHEYLFGGLHCSDVHLGVPPKLLKLQSMPKGG